MFFDSASLLFSMTNNHRMFFASCNVNHKFSFEIWTTKNCRSKYCVFWIVRILVLISIRQLLHRIEPPTQQFAICCDCKSVPEPTSYFHNFIFDWHLYGCRMSRLEKRSDCLSFFAALSTLSESIISHRPNLAFPVKPNEMIAASGYHLHWR